MAIQATDALDREIYEYVCEQRFSGNRLSIFIFPSVADTTTTIKGLKTIVECGGKSPLHQMEVKEKCLAQNEKLL